jgi:Uma2 family endonuclease
MSSVSSLPEQRVVLGNVSWATFLTLVEEAENPRGRMAYDQGVLEIMSPSLSHEAVKCLIGRMVETYTFERSIEIRSVGSTTFKRDDLAKGIEGDECYYVQGAAAIRGVEVIDLLFHPSPDLAIEVDISRSSRIKLGIYAALKVKEVWRYDGQSIHILVLRDDKYDEVEESEVLLEFPIKEAIRLLEQRASIGETELIRQFQTCVRERLR